MAVRKTSRSKPPAPTPVGDSPAGETPSGRGAARRRLLDAALAVIRQKGYSAATVDELCAAAGVTKGAFFHHFASKDALGVAAAEHWSAITGELFANAPYHLHAEPLQRVLAYLDFRKELLRGAVAEFTCLVGTMVQETYDTHPAIRAACAASIHRVHLAGEAVGRQELGHRVGIEERAVEPVGRAAQDAVQA
ncbi:MAG: TetR/AcrR family transcriptional regulator, partial [Planctomycetes bacterium]|nr:TetR/AcrR family transcriptional regulator [Planctomycetota bacterium]